MIVMVVVMVTIVQKVVRGRILLLLLLMEQGLLLLIAAGCCGRLLAVVAAAVAVVLEWQGDTRTRAQRSIEPHCAPLLGGHPALRLFYTAQVQAGFSTCTPQNGRNGVTRGGQCDKRG